MMTIGELCPLVSMLKNKLILRDGLLTYLLSPITSSLFIITSILMTSFQLFGNPIKCQGSSGAGASSEFIDEYCWTTSTFSIRSFPGDDRSTRDTIYHSYYQFLPVVFLFLAGLCMAPQIIWRYWEGGLLIKLVPIKDKQLGVNLLQWLEVKRYSKNISNYFVRNLNSGHHTRYGHLNLVTEVLCFLVILCIIFILQSLLKTFIQYFPHYLFHQIVTPLSISPEESLFPLLAKCSISLVGPSGTFQTEDALCILTVNLINQKVFLVIWLWLAVLLVTSFPLISHTIMTALLPSFRRRILSKQAGGTESCTARGFSKLDRLSYGDWLVLSRLSAHFTPDVVNCIVTELCDNM